MTVPEPADTLAPMLPAAERADGAAVRGPLAVLEVCARAALLLLVGALGILAAFVATEGPSGNEMVDLPTAASIVAVAYGLHLAALLVLGWPGGVLTAHLVRRDGRERVHVAAFALTGLVLGAAVLLVTPAPAAALVWGPLGAVTAGAARAWTGHARRRRAARRPGAPGWAPGPR